MRSLVEHQKKPGSGNPALGPSAPRSGEGPGKRTLTEALPHHPAAHAAHAAKPKGHKREADNGPVGAAANISLVAGRPARAVEPPLPDKERDEDKDDGDDGDDRDDRALRAHATAASVAIDIADAIKQYAPIVHMAKGEANRPADAGEYIRNSSLRWSHDSRRGDHEIAGVGKINQAALGDGRYKHQTKGQFGGHDDRDIPSNADVRPKDKRGDGGSEGFFLDLDNAHRASQKSGTDAPVYYEAVAQHYITYWFFYAFNNGPTPIVGKVDNHEGDWERIVVRLDKNNRATEVAYHQHEGHKSIPWRDVHTSNGHPVVFSAKGSHASYESAGAKPIHADVLGKSRRVGTDQASEGVAWDTEQHLVKAQDQDWYGYGGAWGEVGNADMTTGPQGPSRHKRPAPKGW